MKKQKNRILVTTLLVLILFLALTPLTLAKIPKWTECIHKNFKTSCEEKYLPFDKYVSYETRNGAIKFEWDNNYVEVTPKFKAKSGIINSISNWVNGLAKIDIKIEQQEDSYKYSWNITDIPAPKSIKNVVLEIKSNKEIKWNGNTFYIDDLTFDFSDIEKPKITTNNETGEITKTIGEGGYAINVDKETNTITLENTTGLKEVYIDPTIQTTKTYYGNRVSEKNSNTVDTAWLSIKSNNDGDRYYSYLMINLSKIYDNLYPVDIEEALLTFETYQITNSYSQINVSFYYCDDTYNTSNLTWNNKNTEVTNCDTESFLEWNIPYLENADLATFNITNIIRNHPNSQQFTILMKPNPEQYDNLLSGIDFYNSGATPVLNITYHTMEIITNPTNPYYNQIFNFIAKPDLFINATSCNETIIDSNNNTLFNNSPMTKINSTYFEGSNITANQTYYNATITCVNTNGDTTTKKYQLWTYYYNYSLVYEPEVISTATTTQKIIVDTAPTITLDNALLEYDGTNYTTSRTKDGDRYEVTKTIETDVVDNDENKTFKWYLFFNVLNATTNSTNQTIRAFGVSNCSSVGNESLHFYIRNETSDALVSGTAENEFKVWYADANKYKIVNWKETGVNNYDVCIYPDIGTLHADYTIKYYASSYDTRIKQDNMVNLNTTIQNITLYLGSNTQTINIHISDTNDNAIQNAIVKIFLKDLSTGELKEVESIQTDHEGLAQAKLQTQDNIYKFEIWYGGENVYNSSEFKITSTDIYFQIDLTKYTDLEDYLNILGITHTLSFDNETNTFILTYNDENNYAQKICLKVENRSINEFTTLYDECSGETTNTLQYSIGNPQSGYFLATAYVVANIDGNTYTIDTLSQDFTAGWEIFQKSGVLLGLLIIGTTAFIGLFNPASGILLTIIAIGVVSILGLIHITWAGLIGISVVGIIILLKNKT